ncbi:MAG: bifunctional UDP-N-acetylglucosamine diphosphorylase/glucosamine-1-phosphate N-acetyltransferase GlmU [Candidatus Wenzhouxiangella sp. M2_3B_020]
MSDQPLHLVVLAAGEGKRMNSELPKVLQPVADRPMLAHLVRTAANLAPECIHVVVGHQAERVREALAGIVEVPVETPEQHQRLGTGHAVQQALGDIPDGARVVVLPGDMPLITAGTLERFVESPAALSVLSFVADDPFGYGRILRDSDQRVVGIREQRDATPAEAEVREVNSGVIAADAACLREWLDRVGNANSQGEYYLTDCIELAVADGELVEALVCDDADELMGANDMAQLARLERALQQRRRGELLSAGVRMPAPETVQVRGSVTTGRDVVIDAGVVLEGDVELGDGVVLGAGTVVRSARLAAGTRVEPYCVLEGVETAGAATVGPFARLRPGTVLAADVRIGNFVETKKARFGKGAKANHLTYVGDAEIGEAVNLGAGTITCNYDGANKHLTTIGADAFIGSNTALVAPVTVGEGATIGAGSVVSGEAPAGALTVARARSRTIPDWQRPRKKEGG